MDHIEKQRAAIESLRARRQEDLEWHNLQVRVAAAAKAARGHMDREKARQKKADALARAEKRADARAARILERAENAARWRREYLDSLSPVERQLAELKEGALRQAERRFGRLTPTARAWAMDQVHLMAT